ncbi:hypothetical protein HWV62_7846 [Athelia sp. TMB]|nr:hypothetical protein HWV62_7846 [Athelia sp. TMB]
MRPLLRLWARRALCQRLSKDGSTHRLATYSVSNARCYSRPVLAHDSGVLRDGSHSELSKSSKISKTMSFFPIRDSFGTTQLVVLRKGDAADRLSALSDIPVESTVLIQGQVRLRPEKSRRPESSTGDIEVEVQAFTLLNAADGHMPFVPSDSQNLANEDLRARYRYLDLRRSALSNNLRKRNFLEIETPMLLKSSPEGAREFLVPTRVTRHTDGIHSQDPQFYALPQSPQQPKQLLICSGGVDRYFQLARCFRDEDGRKDRQPEFTQIDLEMAFVSWGGIAPDASVGSDQWRIGGSEVRDVVEGIIRKVWQQMEGISLEDRFRVMTYYNAMTRYGSDKPDIRFGLELSDISHRLSPRSHDTLNSLGQAIECFIVRQSQDGSFVNADQDYQHESDPGVERIVLNADNATSWLSKSRTLVLGLQLESEVQEPDLNEVLNLNIGDSIYLATRSLMPEGGSTKLGRTRLRLAELAQLRGDYVPTETPHFLWVTEFPLFTRADEDKEFLAHGRWSSSHHPFTAPMWQDIEAMYNGDIAKVRGQHYDLVLNGVEIGGGSVRVHDPKMQEHIFANILQLTPHEMASFGHLLDALKFGAPPHGGIALGNCIHLLLVEVPHRIVSGLGFDRLMAILCKTQSIRDVIAFPKTSVGTDLLFKSPATVDQNVLHQYGIQPRH